MIFIRENILNLITDLNYKYIYYRNNTKEANFKNEFDRYYKYIESRKLYLYTLGTLLGNNISHTISEKYIENFKEIAK